MSDQAIVEYVNTLKEYQGTNSKIKEKKQSLLFHSKEFLKMLQSKPGSSFDDYVKSRPKLGQKVASSLKDDVLSIVQHIKGPVEKAVVKAEREDNTAVPVTEKEVEALFQEFLTKQREKVPLVKFKGELDAKGRRIFDSPLFKQMMMDEQKRRSQAAKEALAAPPKDEAVAAAIVPLVGYCPINNPSNWCFLNSAIQMLNDIPELKQAILALTNEQIRGSGKLYTESAPLPLVQNAIQILKTVMDTIENNKDRKAILFSSVQVDLPPKKEVYQAFIDLVRVTDEEAAVLHRQREEAKPLAKRRPFEYPFVYGSQSDADEFLFRIFTFVFASNLNSLRHLKILFTYERFENILCEDKSKGKDGRIESNSILDISLDVPLLKGYTMKGDAIYATSIQDAITYAEVPEVLTEGNNMLEVCGDASSKGKALEKGLKFRVFPFTKYLFVKVKRLVGDEYYLGNVVVNKTLTIDGVQFQPRGVIYHRGGIIRGRTVGHYIYYHFENGEPTIECNDATVRPIMEKARPSIMNALNGDGNGGARVILYERIGPVNLDLLAKIKNAEDSVLALKQQNFLAKSEAEKAARAAKNAKNLGKRSEERLKVFKNISNGTRKAIQVILNAEPKVNAPVVAAVDNDLNELEKMRDALLDELEKQFESEDSNDASSVSSSNTIELAPQDSNSENSDGEVDPETEALLEELLNLGVEIDKLNDYSKTGLQKRLEGERQKASSPRTQAAILRALTNDNIYSGGKTRRRSRIR